MNSTPRTAAGFWLADDPTRANWDKEYVRKWLTTHGFAGEGGRPPELPEELAYQAASRYVEVLERLTGRPFEPGSYPAAERVVGCPGIAARGQYQDNIKADVAKHECGTAPGRGDHGQYVGLGRLHAACCRDARWLAHSLRGACRVGASHPGSHVRVCEGRGGSRPCRSLSRVPAAPPICPA